MLSVAILTKNEEKLLETCLLSVKWADEIIVVDDASTDQTVEIAKKYTDKVFVHQMESFPKQRNFAMEKTTGDWVLFVDADERVTKALRDEIISTANAANAAAAYAIPRRNFFLGAEQKQVGAWPDYVIRLLKKSTFKSWGGDLHENPTFDGDLQKLSQPFIHLTHRDITQMTLKTLDWSKREAKLRLDANHPKMTSWRFIRILKTSFFDWYIRKGGFRGGTEGTIEAIFQTFSMFFTYVRLWEMQQQPSLQEKYEQIDVKLLESDFTQP